METVEDIWFELTEFINKIVEILLLIIEVTDKTVVMLNDITFADSNSFTHYLGYARYVFGAPLWALFTTVLLIPIGVTLYIYTLKGIGYIKNLNFFN